MGPAGGGYRSSAADSCAQQQQRRSTGRSTALSSECKQCHVYNRRGRLNTDLCIERSGTCAVDSLLAAVSTVLWGHLHDVSDADQLIGCLRQVLLDNLLSNANRESPLATRWKLHNDLLASDTPVPVNNTITGTDPCDCNCR